MKLTEIEKISQLIYKNRSTEFLKFSRINNLRNLAIEAISGNDRVAFFEKGDNIYIAIAGSDDKQDWKENFMVRTMKQLFYGFKGYALPAFEIRQKFIDWVIKNGIIYHDRHIVITGHSRGGGISNNLYVQMKESGISDIDFMHGRNFGNPGAGSFRFRKIAGECDIINFEIKGDPVPSINFLAKSIGKVVKLPKQEKGFFHRLKMLFKGEMNHRSYDCIAKYEPWKDMEDIDNV